MKALVMYIGSKMIEAKLKCDYCDHHQISEFLKATANNSVMKTMTTYQRHGNILKSKFNEISE